LNNDSYEFDLHVKDLLDRRTHRSGMIFSSAELVSLVHLPNSTVRIPKLVRDARRTKAAPLSTKNNPIVLGENQHAGEVRTVTVSDEQRLRHTHVIGSSGSGKSTFLINQIRQDIERGSGLAVFDPHGDLIDQIIGYIPEERYDDVILFDPSDEAFPIGFNILSAHSELEKNLISSDMVSVFQRLSTSWGDQMTAVLQNAILAMLESSRSGTLLDLRRFLVESEFRDDFLKSVTDSQVIYFWKKEFPMLVGRPQAPLLTRLNTFLGPRLIRNMVSQRENRIDFAKVMDGRKIFLAKLSQGALGEENSYLLGSLLVAKFYQLVMSRQAVEASSRRHFWLYIDEFHNFVCSSMASILTGARKYRLGLTLAHQELKQIEHRDSNVSGAVLANPYTRICFRLGDDDARKLGSGFSYFEPRDLQNLGVGEAICRIERSDYDFNLKVPFPPQVPDEIAKEKRIQIREFSRKKYGTPKDIVEERIERELADLFVESESIDQDTRKRRAKQAEGSRPSPSSPHNEDSSPEPDRSTVSQDRDKNDPSAGNTEAETPLGKYKTLHEPLKERFISEGEACDYTVEREVSVLGGSGRIDLVFTRGDLKIACEIDVKNDIEYEARNVRKCSDAGFRRIVVTAPSRKRLQQIEKAVGTSVDPEIGVNYFLPDELTAALREWAEADPVGGKKERAKPRKQKVRFESGELTSEERREKEKQMLRTLTESMNRKKDLS
jgi:DNA helicase HerA-like ATPase